jgi:hypothetical protein
VTADLACAIVDNARVISDFRVHDQAELFRPVASVPTAERVLGEIAVTASAAGPATP